MQNLRLGKGDKEAIKVLYGQNFEPKIDLGKKKRPIFEDIDICGNSWDAILLCRLVQFHLSHQNSLFNSHGTCSKNAVIKFSQTILEFMP